jgi:hypothetical protein
MNAGRPDVRFRRRRRHSWATIPLSPNGPKRTLSNVRISAAEREADLTRPFCTAWVISDTASFLNRISGAKLLGLSECALC